MHQILNIQIKNINKQSFSLRKNNDDLLHITNSNEYHIIFFDRSNECEVNFKRCRLKDTQVLFLSPSDVFICRAKRNTISQFSFNHEVFDNEYCETQRLINGLLFNSLLNDNILKFNTEGFSKFQTQINNILTLQRQENSKDLKMSFKEMLIQSITQKHKQIFSKSEISKNHHTVYKYLSLINTYFNVEHNVFDYAQILKLQPKILTKIFHDLKIKNPKSYLNERILFEAKKLLSYSLKKATTISYELGFNEPAYFARFFKKNTGLTSKEFRIMQKFT